MPKPCQCGNRGPASAVLAIAGAAAIGLRSTGPGGPDVIARLLLVSVLLGLTVIIWQWFRG